jgi:hypothetical protein
MTGKNREENPSNKNASSGKFVFGINQNLFLMTDHTKG